MGRALCLGPGRPRLPRLSALSLSQCPCTIPWPHTCWGHTEEQGMTHCLWDTPPVHPVPPRLQDTPPSAPCAPTPTGLTPGHMLTATYSAHQSSSAQRPCSSGSSWAWAVALQELSCRWPHSLPSARGGTAGSPLPHLRPGAASSAPTVAGISSGSLPSGQPGGPGAGLLFAQTAARPQNTCRARLAGAGCPVGPCRLHVQHDGTRPVGASASSEPSVWPSEPLLPGPPPLMALQEEGSGGSIVW